MHSRHSDWNEGWTTEDLGFEIQKDDEDQQASNSMGIADKVAGGVKLTTHVSMCFQGVRRDITFTLLYTVHRTV